MDKQQAQNIIKETFESSFDESSFIEFIKNLLNRIEEDTFTYKGQFIPDSYKHFINKYIRVGKFNNSGNRIDILIVYLSKDTSIERARSKQRNFVAGYLQGKYGSTTEKNAALVAFVSRDKADWRFSLVKLDYSFKQGKDGALKATEEFTPARRWSFLVGKNEKSHTAQISLVNILKNDEQDPGAGTRKVPFSKVLYIEQDDFMEDPPKKFYRLSPGREVRLRYAYFVTCTDVVKDDKGRVVELHCSYDPATRGGNAPDGRKAKSTIHWVSVANALKAEVRLYDHLFTKERPEDVTEGEDFKSNLNPNSLQVLTDCMVEPGLKEAKALDRFQFERLGYFCVDPDTTSDNLVFNRTVTLRDTWAKIQKKQQK